MSDKIEISGYADGRIVSVSRCTESFKRDLSDHLVLKIGVVPAEGERNTHETYYQVVPYLLTVGMDYRFYNREKACFEDRKVTMDDQTAALEALMKWIPALNDKASASEAYAWLMESAADEEVPVRAKFENRTARKDGTPLVDKEGLPKTDHVCYLCESRNAKESVRETIDAFERKFKSCRVKFGGKAEAKPVEVKSEAAVKAESPSVPDEPSAPESPSPMPDYAKYSPNKAGTWACYHENTPNDPEGKEFWQKVQEAVGKSYKEWQYYSAADWKKAIDAFNMPF